MNRQLDVLFVNADSSAKAYQDLSKDYSAVETPTWCLCWLKVAGPKALA